MIDLLTTLVWVSSMLGLFWASTVATMRIGTVWLPVLVFAYLFGLSALAATVIAPIGTLDDPPIPWPDFVVLVNGVLEFLRYATFALMLLLIARRVPARRSGSD